MDLYVIEKHIGSEACLLVYRLVESRKTGFVVDIRGTRRFMKRHVNGRHYFQSREEAVEFLRLTHGRELDSLRRQIRRLEFLAGAGDDLLLDCAKGKDSAWDAVETGAGLCDDQQA